MFPLLAIFVMNPNDCINNNWSDKNMMNKKIIGVMALALVMIVGACPAFAASSSSSTQTVQVTVDDTIAIAAKWNSGLNNSTIDLGALTADGIQKTFAGGAAGEQLYTYSNVAIDVYTKASGDLTGSSGSIALSNFLYKGGSATTATAFTTSYTKMYEDWDKAALNSGYNVAPIDLSLTAPFGTAPGTYSNIVYFSAVKSDNNTVPSLP
ncbi:hypothetical protein DSECCO2_126050 [anaerobic digester metagenome]